MTQLRPASRRFLSLRIAATLFIAPWVAAQLLATAAESPKGEPVSSVAEPEQSAPGQPKAEPSQTVTVAPETRSVAPDLSAFIAALSAAERANENLAARIAQMEASVTRQRESDQLFMRDMIKGILLLAGGMAGVGLLALVSIVFLQVRAAKQQALTFAAQWQALATHAALPPPSIAPAAAIKAVQDQFESTAHRLEQKLSDLEAMATGLPVAGGPVHTGTTPQTGSQSRAFVSEYTAPPVIQPGASRDGRSSDLLTKANSLLQQQQPEVALAYLDQAIIHNPHNAQAHLKKGAALERLNLLNEALSACDGAIEADHSLSVAFLAKAGVLNKLQRYSEALKCYEEALVQPGGQDTSQSPAA